MIARKPKSSVPASSGEKLFAKLAAFYGATDTHVERVKLFGFDCLRVDGKVFAKLHNGHLVMKLPASRIAALIDFGCLGSYECRGRLMKEWGIVATANKDIVALAEESRAFTENKHRAA
ncbi:MAG: hypothetical protein KGI37_04995 [Alphaproteobacteria bacterium]|nr:hypothetical protein [Alphaproteobacteria bacterium]